MTDTIEAAAAPKMPHTTRACDIRPGEWIRLDDMDRPALVMSIGRAFDDDPTLSRASSFNAVEFRLGGGAVRRALPGNPVAFARTLAEAFVADGDACAFDEPYDACQTFGVDETAEYLFSDQSCASVAPGRAWLPQPLTPEERAAAGPANDNDEPDDGWRLAAERRAEDRATRNTYDG